MCQIWIKPPQAFLEDLVSRETIRQFIFVISISPAWETLAGAQVDANNLLELYNIILYDFFKVEHSRIIQEPPAHREMITLHRRWHVKFGKVFENYIANLPLSIEIPSWQGYPWQKLSPRQSECSASILFFNSTTIFSPIFLSKAFFKKKSWMKPNQMFSSTRTNQKYFYFLF